MIGGWKLSRTEDNCWFLLIGILIGMELAFWFWPDVDFYRTVWPALTGAMIGWYIVRRKKNGEKR